jgi:hypothetical protein
MLRLSLIGYPRASSGRANFEHCLGDLAQMAAAI